MRKEIVIAENRRFEGVWIPKRLYMATNLSARTKFCLIEIRSLSVDGYCWATDNHFADFLGISTRMVQTILKELKEIGYLETEYEYEPGTKAIKRRFLILTEKFYDDFYNEKPVDKTDFLCEGTEKNFSWGTEKNCVGIYNNKPYITNINSDSQNTNKKHNSPKTDEKKFPAGKSEEDNEKKILEKVRKYTDEETIINGIDYYLKKYRAVMGTEHPLLVDSIVKKIVERISSTLSECWFDLEDNNRFPDLVNRHFDTDYGQFVDFNLVHFSEPSILYYQAINIGLIDGIEH